MSQTALIRAARKRLQGAWRSDRTRTMAGWRFARRVGAKKRKEFASIFGKNIWRFGPRLCTSQFEDQRATEPYRILWANNYSAVVLFRNKGETTCHHLFFDGDSFYVAAGRAGNVEYFKRIPSSSAVGIGRAIKRRAIRRKH